MIAAVMGARRPSPRKAARVSSPSLFSATSITTRKAPRFMKQYVTT